MTEKDILASQKIVVQTDIEGPAESFAINTGKLFLFDVCAITGERTMILGLPISFAYVEDAIPAGAVSRVLYVNDITTNQAVSIQTSSICGVFPACAEGEQFTQACLSNFPLHELWKAFSLYVEAARDARSLPALQFEKLAELENALNNVTWVREEGKPEDVTPEQYAVVGACADLLFRLGGRYIAPGDYNLRRMLRDVAVEMMRLAPTVQQQWLEADRAGEAITRLNRQLNDAKNLLKLHNIPFTQSAEETPNG